MSFTRLGEAAIFCLVYNAVLIQPFFPVCKFSLAFLKFSRYKHNYTIPFIYNNTTHLTVVKLVEKCASVNRLKLWKKLRISNKFSWCETSNL